MGKNTISLWSLIEKMQKSLEAEGLEHEVVDAAVTLGLETILEEKAPRDRLLSILFQPTPAEA